MQFNYVQRDGSANITLVIDGDLYVADEQHPSFNEIVDAARADDAKRALNLINASVGVSQKFENLSERVAVKNSRVYVDGDEIDDVFTDQIIRFLKEDVDDWVPLVLFLEKVYTNTDAHTRDNLSRWLKATKGFTIDEDGDIVGYKGVTNSLGSIHHGPAIVNGEDVNGSVPNQPGSVIEMPRSKVTHNPAVGCASGLHVGTWDYASGFGQIVLEVKVNPRDVVSVPTDCNGQKMRVSRYKVVRVLDRQYNQAVVPNGFVPAEDYDDDDVDWD